MNRSDMLLRFTRAERWVHWTTAGLMLVCIVTAALLYVGPLAILVGRRPLVSTIHVWAGYALPLPMVLGWLSRSFRTDVSALNRFLPDDWRWLGSRGWRTYAVSSGKFNAGQKLSAAFFTGAILVMLGTGLIMAFPDPWPDSSRTGATFVHDWLALVIVIVVIGHLRFALRDPVALRGMRTGFVPDDWAREQHPAWSSDSVPDRDRPRPTATDRD